MRDDQIHDDIRYCARCGISFLWSSEEQKAGGRQTPQAGPPPQHCAGCRRLLPAPDRERGMVKWYNARKRYGFLTRRHAPEIFFHHSALAAGLRVQPGDLVEFAVDTGDKGLQAAAIRAATVSAAAEFTPVPAADIAGATGETPDDAGPPS